jgi:hypothetical protein
MLTDAEFALNGVEYISNSAERYAEIFLVVEFMILLLNTTVYFNIIN